MLTCWRDHRVVLWDLSTGKAKIDLEGRRDVYYHSVAFSPDGKLILVGTGHRGQETDDFKTVRMWRVEDGEEMSLEFKETAYVEAVAYAPDGKYFAHANGYGELRIWDAESRKVVKKHRIKGSSARVLLFGPDGKTLVAGLSGGQIIVLDWGSGEQLHAARVRGNNISQMVLSSDGKTLVTTSFQQVIQIWDFPVLKEKHAFTGRGLVSLCPNRKLLAFESAIGRVQFVETNNLEVKGSFQAHQRDVIYIVFSADGKKLATTSIDNTCKVWELDKILEKKH